MNYPLQVLIQSLSEPISPDSSPRNVSTQPINNSAAMYEEYFIPVFHPASRSNSPLSSNLLSEVTITGLIQSLSNRPDLQFHGYVNLLAEDDLKCLITFKDYRLQIIGTSDRGYELLLAHLPPNSLISVYSLKSISELIPEKSISSLSYDVIDLEHSGRRWEGQVLNDIPFGYGMEYNDDNNPIYEGFMVGNTKVCYGMEYRGIHNCPRNDLIYVGGYLDGVRFGVGQLFDLKGILEYEGEWIDHLPANEFFRNRIPIHSCEDLNISTSVEEIVIADRSLNDSICTSLHFPSLLCRLKRIYIGNECFHYVREIVLDGLKSLESLKIGVKCFSISYNERQDGLFRVKNCHSLSHMEIGDFSFRDYKQFELAHLDSLQSLQFGLNCFFYAEKCIIKGW